MAVKLSPAQERVLEYLSDTDFIPAKNVRDSVSLKVLESHGLVESQIRLLGYNKDKTTICGRVYRKVGK